MDKTKNNTDPAEAYDQLVHKSTAGMNPEQKEKHSEDCRNALKVKRSWQRAGEKGPGWSTLGHRRVRGVMVVSNPTRWAQRPTRPMRMSNDRFFLCNRTGWFGISSQAD